MFIVPILWAFLLLVSTAGGLVLAHVGAQSEHKSVASGGVVGCIVISTLATILLLAGNSLGSF